MGRALGFHTLLLPPERLRRIFNPDIMSTVQVCGYRNTSDEREARRLVRNIEVERRVALFNLDTVNRTNFTRSSMRRGGICELKKVSRESHIR